MSEKVSKTDKKIHFRNAKTLVLRGNVKEYE